VTYAQFDLALTLFPFLEKRGQKIRPVAVLSIASFNEQHQRIVAAMITTASHTSWPRDILIRQYRSAGLKQPSVVRFKIFSLPVQRLIGRIGSFSAEDRTRIADQLKSIVGGS
jgi:mRNA-degrading endonuclease toxin of MazEF toxin-antitoxin module